ncbi:MAG: CDP-diacylglycerol--serine O-phosphatidyltransferase [Myxococcales bacterium]|nr:CDP-diacylglycerol--serine O-phosphatidyltransferase [Myxococcales bacterium]
MNLRKTFFILPNLFTLASVFCGFFAIATVAAGGNASPGALYQAAIAISFGFFFDLADGRVARLTKTQSALGLQLDSLADLITFGVAPALLMYRWGLDQMETHHAGIAITFLYVAAAALRLARFNVLAIKESDENKKPGKYILGLPVPVAAAVLISLVVLNHQLGGSLVDVGQAALAMMVIALSYLMVSRVRFRSFKDLRLSRRTLTLVGGAVAAALIAVFWKRVPSAFVFVVMMGAYLALGLLEEVIFYRRRRDEAAAAHTPTPASVEAVSGGDGGARSDEEVLEELGAYDGDRDEAKPAPGDPVPGLPVLK